MLPAALLHSPGEPVRSRTAVRRVAAGVHQLDVGLRIARSLRASRRPSGRPLPSRGNGWRRSRSRSSGADDRDRTGLEQLGKLAPHPAASPASAPRSIERITGIEPVWTALARQRGTLPPDPHGAGTGSRTRSQRLEGALGTTPIVPASRAARRSRTGLSPFTERMHPPVLERQGWRRRTRAPS